MKHKKAFMGILTLGLLTSFSLGASMITLAESEIDESKFTMYQGASVRTEGTAQYPNAQGLRFKTYAAEFKSDLQAVYSPNQYNYNWYTQIRFKLYSSTSGDTDVYESYTTDVPAYSWHADGWNTVLLDIPTSAVAVDITAQSFVEVKNKNGTTVYETNTEPRTYSAAETASWALAYNMWKTDTEKTFLESYVKAAVSSGEISEINLLSHTVGVEVGGSDYVIAETRPMGYGITYKSNNTSIATVDGTGRVTGVKAGTTTITLSVGTLTKTCNVKVVEKDSVPAAITSWSGTATSWNSTQMYPFYYRSSSYTKAAIENGKIKLTPSSTVSSANACFLELKYDYLDKVFALSKVKAVRIKLTGLANYRIGNMRIWYYKSSGEAMTDEYTRYDQDGDTVWVQFNRGLYEKYLSERRNSTTKFCFRIQFQSATGATSNSIVKPSTFYIEEISPVYDSVTEDFEYGANAAITADNATVERITERTNGRGMYALNAQPTGDTLTVNIASAYANKVFASGATALEFRLYTDKDLTSVTVNGATESVQYAYNADGEYYVIRIGAAYNGNALSVAIQAKEALGSVYLDTFKGSDKTPGANVTKSSAYAKNNGTEIQFKAGESFNFYAYGSLSNGILNLGDKKEDYAFEEVSLETMLELKEAGFDAIMPQSLAAVGEDGATRGTYNYKTILDLAARAGLKVILTDDPLIHLSAGKQYDASGAKWPNWKSYYESAKETSGQWAGAATQSSAMYTKVKSQLQSYINHPAFGGVLMIDEPPIWMLDESLPNTQEYTKSGTFGFTYKTVKRVAQEVFGKDIFIHANVLPAGLYSDASYGHGVGQRFPELTVARYGEITGMDVSSYAVDSNGYAKSSTFYTDLTEYVDTLGSTDAGLTSLMERDVILEIQRERYGLYCQKFLEATGADYLMPDIYPMRDGVLASNRHLMEIQTAAEVAAQYGADLHLITQTMKHLDGERLERPLLENDLRWMNNILLSYGVKNIVYFTYHVHGSDGSTNFDKDSSFVDETGEKTDVWFTMQQIMSENKAFEKTYQSFDIQSIKTYYNTLAVFDGEYGSASNDIKFNDGSLYVNDTVTFTALKNVKVDGEFTTVSEYKSANGAYMYAIMNMTDGKFANDSAAHQSATLTFGSQYTHAILWRNGEKKLVALDENHSLEIENAAGEAVFVIVYKYTESSNQNDGNFYDPDQEDNGIWFPGNENAVEESSEVYFQDPDQEDNGIWFPGNENAGKTW